MRTKISKPAEWLLFVVVLFSGLTSFGTDGRRGSSSSSDNRRRRYAGRKNSRSIQVVNKSGVKFDIFWVHPDTGELANSNTEGKGLMYGADNVINSYIGHVFEVVEMGSFKGCRSKRCETGRFQVSSNEDQVFTVWENFTVSAEDHQTRALDMAKQSVEKCLVNASDASMSNLTAEQQIEAMSKCMGEKVKQTLKETEEEIAFQAALRLDMGNDLTRYACLDQENATVTKSVHNMSWDYYSPMTRRHEDYNVQVLFETFESKAILVEEFMTRRQCQSLQKHGDALRGVVPLKAKQDHATVELMLKVQNLVKAFVSHSLSFNEEPLLQYHARIASDSSSDPATTATTCLSAREGGQEGECTIETTKDGNSSTLGLLEMHKIPAKTRGTIVLFCDSTGGALHFPRTGVHLPASPDMAGSAFLISHKNEEEEDEDYYLDDEDEDNDDDASKESDTADVYMGEYALCLPTKPDTEMNVFWTSF